MRTFTDNAGRTWTVQMNLDAAKRVLGLLKVNLLELEQGTPSPLQRLATDLMFICDLIFVLVKPQADQLGVTDVQFGEAMGGDAIQAAHNALMEELGDFFRKAGRSHLAKAIEVQERTVNLTIQVLGQKVETISPEKLAEKIGQEAEKRLQKTLGELSTNSPDSSDSTPAR